MNKQEAARLVGVLSAAYPGKPVPHETVQVYATMLQDLDANTAAEAVKTLIQTSPYWPAISEIRGGCQTIEGRNRRERPRQPELDVPEDVRRSNLQHIRGWAKSIGWNMP